MLECLFATASPPPPPSPIWLCWLTLFENSLQEQYWYRKCMRIYPIHFLDHELILQIRKIAFFQKYLSLLDINFFFLFFSFLPPTHVLVGWCLVDCTGKLVWGEYFKYAKNPQKIKRMYVQLISPDYGSNSEFEGLRFSEIPHSKPRTDILVCN